MHGLQKWVHVDPCEASVAEPLLYEGWGKNQTYIFAVSTEGGSIEDVTATYTSNLTAALERRDATPEEISEAVQAAKAYLLTNPSR